LLVTDMACLVQLLNLTEVYSPKSTIKIVAGVIARPLAYTILT
jgi:hypothetical protein